MALNQNTAFEAATSYGSGPRQATVGQHFLRDLERLWTDLLRVAAVVENALRHSVDVLVHRRTDLTNSIIADEHMIDRWEVRIEEKCLTILALHQPVASDLRRVAAVLKLNTLMEKLSDLASHIAVRARKLDESRGDTNLTPEFEELASCCLEILSESLDSLTRCDSIAARRILDVSRAVKIERLRNIVRKQMKQAIRDNIENFDTALRIMNIARNLKRVAEHAQDVAVEVVYLSEGLILRHQSDREQVADDVD